MDIAVALALVSLFAATLLSNVLARRRERAWAFDPVTTEAREMLREERATPTPLCPTLHEEHWSRLTAAQPAWRREAFCAARANYEEARAAFSRDALTGELYYPDPSTIVGATHAVLVLTERH